MKFVWLKTAKFYQTKDTTPCVQFHTNFCNAPHAADSMLAQTKKNADTVFVLMSASALDTPLLLHDNQFTLLFVFSGGEQF